MIIRNIKKHGTSVLSYSGEIENSKVIVVFENGVKPVEGDIQVTLGKMITKNNQNYYYVRGYQGE